MKYPKKLNKISYYINNESITGLIKIVSKTIKSGKFVKEIPF